MGTNKFANKNENSAYNFCEGSVAFLKHATIVSPASHGVPGADELILVSSITLPRFLPSCKSKNDTKTKKVTWKIKRKIMKAKMKCKIFKN